MSFMHMDATTAASAIGDNIQLLDQTCASLSFIASMGLRETGRMFCFQAGGTFPWDWIDPLSDAPGDPTYQVRRINTVGDEPVFGPLDGVFTDIGITAIDSATVQSPGTGYSVNDQLALVGGIFVVPAIFNVDSVFSGFVTSVSLVDKGSYQNPAGPNPISTTLVNIGPGTGCTLNVNFTFLFNWVFLTGGLGVSFDVELRKGTGTTLRTASWGMSTAGGTIP